MNLCFLCFFFSQFTLIFCKLKTKSSLHVPPQSSPGTESSQLQSSPGIVTSQSDSFNILVLHPVYAGSHILAIRTLIEKLLSKGHKVTVVRWEESSQIKSLKSDNYQEIVLAVDNHDGRVPFMTHQRRAMFEFPSDLMWKRGLWPTSVFEGGMISVAAACEAMFQNQSLFQKLQTIKFQVAIVDIIANECGLALAYHLNVPVVGYWGLSFISGETQYTTAFNSPAFIPHMYLPFTDRMNFLERMINFYYGFCSHLVMQLQFWHTNYYIQKYLPGVPHPSSLLSNVSGFLINSHFAFDYPKQLPATFLQVGGFHIKAPSAALPPELEIVFKESTHGVILFTLGKNFDAQSLPDDVISAYLKAFASLNQTVIMKSSIVPKQTPKNVKIFSYVPQVDILAHKKTVLFITHCGLHGVMEAIKFGVKMVAIPIFFDQGNVAARLTDLGVATRLSKTSDKDEILQAVTDILEQPKYEANMRRLTRIYHSSFDDSLSKSVWLVEHVMEFNGAEHMKLASRSLNFIQYFCLDVILVLLLLGISQIYMVVKVCRYINMKFLSFSSKRKVS